jgi:hypothetical protein
MPFEISDEEFEANLEKVYEAWEAGRDTFDIAALCGISEAKAAYILRCYLDGKFHRKEDGEMPKHLKDDWDKPRTQGNHLTDDEIKKLRVAYTTGRHPSDIARELQCSSRVANKYYAMFRGNSPVSRVRRPRDAVVARAVAASTPQPAPQPKSRFYTSNFEL